MMTPSKLRLEIASTGLTRKEFCRRHKVGEEVLSRYLRGLDIFDEDKKSHRRMLYIYDLMVVGLLCKDGTQ